MEFAVWICKVPKNFKYSVKSNSKNGLISLLHETGYESQAAIPIDAAGSHLTEKAGWLNSG